MQQLEVFKQQDLSGWSYRRHFKQWVTQGVKQTCAYMLDGTSKANFVYGLHGLMIGKENVVARESEKLMSLFNCKDVGPMEEYMGARFKGRQGETYTTGSVAEFSEEFGVEKDKAAVLPAKPGQVLTKGIEQDVLNATLHTKFRSGVGKLRYLATWSRPEILNLVREVSRHVSKPTQEHNMAMLNIMNIVLQHQSMAMLNIMNIVLQHQSKVKCLMQRIYGMVQGNLNSQ
jgi:hypothetical protein